MVIREVRGRQHLGKPGQGASTPVTVVCGLPQVVRQVLHAGTGRGRPGAVGGRGGACGNPTGCLTAIIQSD